MSSAGLALQTTLLVAALLISVVTDLRYKRIFNWLTFPAMLAGLAVSTAMGGWHGLLMSLAGAGVSLLSLLVVAVGGMKFGDVKLLMAVGTLMGPHFTLLTLICTAIAGGVFGVVYALRCGELAYTIKNAMVGGHVLSSTKSAEGLKGMASTSKVGYMPYAPAIAAGAAVAAYLLHAHIV